MCADVFLLRNGYDLTCEKLELYDVTMRAANNQVTREQIADWIRNNLKPRV